MFRASRYRLYPNKTQEQQFQRLCGVSRFVTNELLSEQVESYKQFKKSPAGEPRKNVKAKSGLNRKLSNFFCLGMLERLLQYKVTDWVKVPAQNTSRRSPGCGTGRGEDNKARAFFMEGLVETAYDSVNYAMELSRFPSYKPLYNPLART